MLVKELLALLAHQDPESQVVLSTDLQHDLGAPCRGLKACQYTEQFPFVGHVDLYATGKYRNAVVLVPVQP